MFDPGGKVYRATVISASPTTGDVTVLLAGFGTSRSSATVSKVGRTPTSGVWKVPTVGSQVFVSGDDDNLSNICLIPSFSYDNTVVAVDGKFSGAISGNTISGNTISGNTISANTFSGSGSGLTGIPNSATTATNENNPNTIVSRDASGNFTAGTVTATLNGSAPAGSLTGTALSSGVTTSSLTSVGTLTTLTVSGGVTAASFSGSLSGNGSLITNLNASNLSSGTVPSAQITGNYTNITSVGTLDVLNVTGAATLSSTLNVTGITTLSAQVNVSTQLRVTGATTLLSTVTASGIGSTSTTTGFQALYWSTSDSSIQRFTSQRATKERIANISGSGKILDSLRPVTFIPKATNPETSEQKKQREADVQHGFIAEEVAEVAGGLLAAYAPDTDNAVKPVAWRQNDMIALLVAEVKDLRSRIKELETK